MPKTKRKFDIEAVIARVRTAVETFSDAAMFELAELGHRSVFHQLVACVISIRTRDEVMLPTAIRLFERARTPAEMATLTTSEIDRLIEAATFHSAKADQILAIARRTVDEFGGELPCDYEVLTSFRGVGPKCAGLALGIACGQPYIGVDVHVHREIGRAHV